MGGQEAEVSWAEEAVVPQAEAVSHGQVARGYVVQGGTVLPERGEGRSTLVRSSLLSGVFGHRCCLGYSVIAAGRHRRHAHRTNGSTIDAPRWYNMRPHLISLQRVLLIASSADVCMTRHDCLRHMWHQNVCAHTNTTWCTHSHAYHPSKPMPPLN